MHISLVFFFQAEDGIRDKLVTGVQTCALPISKVGVDAELVTETLVGDDAVRGQLDTQAVRVLVADAAARERRGARADGVALEDDHRPHAEPGQMVGRAHAHDPGPDDHDFSGFRHAATILQSRCGGDPMATLDPVWATVAELSHAFATRALSPVDVVDALMARTSRRNPALHAYIAVYEAEARLAAEAADKAMRSGHRVGPLHGVPIALKDLVDLQGRVTTGGSKVWAERVSPVTATLAERLIAAGMIVLGKTHTVEFAMGSWGTNTHMGTPRNPWDMQVHRTPGGSSSGSGVAVSAGLTPAAIGTDTGGSVRLPASWCGIVGLKTTAGRISTYGVLPLSSTLDTPGPMTRSVEDAALLYRLLNGPDPNDPATLAWAPDDPLPALRRGVAGLRLATMPEAERTGVDREVLAAYDASVDVLHQLGATIVPIELPNRFADYAN